MDAKRSPGGAGGTSKKADTAGRSTQALGSILHDAADAAMLPGWLRAVALKVWTVAPLGMTCIQNLISVAAPCLRRRCVRC